VVGDIPAKPRLTAPSSALVRVLALTFAVWWGVLK
jgi:hypothetical protein